MRSLHQLLRLKNSMRLSQWAHAQCTCTRGFVVCTNAGESFSSSISDGKKIIFTSGDRARYLPGDQLHHVIAPSLAQETDLPPPPLFGVRRDAFLRPLKQEAPEPAMGRLRVEHRSCKLWFLMHPQSGQPRAPLLRYRIGLWLWKSLYAIWYLCYLIVIISQIFL